MGLLQLKSRPEWLSARRLGASDSAAILGLSRWSTPYQVWGRKVGVLPEVEENEAMRLGRRLEPACAAEFAERTGYEVTELPAHSLYICDDAPFMTATPDRLVQVGAFPGLLECKATGSHAASDWKDGIPDEAHFQALHQLACTDLDFCYVAAIIGSTSFAHHRVERDDALIARMKEQLAAFWELVETRTPPPMTGADAAVVDLLYPASSPNKHVSLDPTFEQLIERAERAKAAAKLSQQRADEALNELKMKMGDAETATVGKYRLSWKTVEVKAHMRAASSYRKFSYKER